VSWIYAFHSSSPAAVRDVAPEKVASRLRADQSMQTQPKGRRRIGKDSPISLPSKLVMTAIPPVPGLRRWRAMRNQCVSILDAAAGEMEVYHNQRSDAWQDSERGEEFADMMESMAEIAAALRDIDQS